MATLMQKDVLLEATNLGLMKGGLTEEARADITRLGEIKKFLLMTKPQDIETEKVMTEIMGIRKKYQWA